MPDVITFPGPPVAIEATEADIEDPEIERICRDWHTAWKKGAIRKLCDLYMIIHDLPFTEARHDHLLERIGDLVSRIAGCSWTGDRTFAYQHAFNREIFALCTESERLVRGER